MQVREKLQLSKCDEKYICLLVDFAGPGFHHTENAGLFQCFVLPGGGKKLGLLKRRAWSHQAKELFKKCMGPAARNRTEKRWIDGRAVRQIA